MKFRLINTDKLFSEEMSNIRTVGKLDLFFKMIGSTLETYAKVKSGLPVQTKTKLLYDDYFDGLQRELVGHRYDKYLCPYRFEDDKVMKNVI